MQHFIHSLIKLIGINKEKNIDKKGMYKNLHKR